MNPYEMCFYAPGKPGIIDYAVPQPDGTYVGGYSRETLEQVNVRYPGAVVMPTETAYKASCELFRCAPVEITEEQFNELYECLPMYKVHGGPDTFSCMCPEYITGQVTTIQARIGTRYFQFADYDTLTHAEIIERVKAALLV